MVTTWRESYAELTSYISNNTEIVLEIDRLEIPEEHRGDFYVLFDRVRSLFVKEECQEFLESSKVMSKSYLHAERMALDNNGLNEVSLPPYLRWLLNDEVDGLKRVLYNYLFDLIRQKINIEQFRAQGRKSITEHYAGLKVLCYQYWIMLTLNNLLKPDNYYFVDLSLGTSSAASVQGAVHYIKPVKDPEITDRISLAHSLINIFIVPQILIYSTAINRFVAIRSEPINATWTAENRSENVEWLPVGQQTLIPGLITVNTSDNLKDLALVRDRDVMARPEIAFICRESSEWYEQDWLVQFEQMSFNHELLKPRRGLYVLSRPDVPEDFINKMEFQCTLRNLANQDDSCNENEIKILNIGMDESKIEKLLPLLNTKE